MTLPKGQLSIARAGYTLPVFNGRMADRLDKLDERDASDEFEIDWIGDELKTLMG